jgi:hypothetical protein
MLNMNSPAIEGVSPFRKKLVTLVHGSDAENRPALVIKHFVSDVRRNAKPGHARHARAAQVVKSPH